MPAEVSGSALENAPAHVSAPPARSLPKNVDKERVTATLRDGVLRVSIPKLPLRPDVAVPVSTTPLPDDLAEPRATTTLALPGISAADLTVVIKTAHDSSLSLHVSGRAGGLSVHEVLRLPSRSRPAEATAACVNGVFTFSVPLTAERVTAVAVSAEAATEPPSDTDLCLLQAPVPGLCAADVSVELRGNALSVTSAKAPVGGRALRVNLRLPASAASAEQLRASCVHGLLTITATGAAPARRIVPLNGASAPADVAMEDAAAPPGGQ